MDTVNRQQGTDLFCILKLFSFVLEKKKQTNFIKLEFFWSNQKLKKMNLPFIFFYLYFTDILGNKFFTTLRE
jgi:hypothetical protein